MRPDGSSLRATRHQSRRASSRSARARMMSEVACEPELPPELMMSGMKSESTTARAISSSKWLHGRRGEHLAEEEGAEPAGALADHRAEPDLRVRLVEGLQAAQALHLPCLLGDQGVDHVVDRDDAEEASGLVHDGQREQVVLADEARRVLARGAGRDRDQACAWRHGSHGRVGVGHGAARAARRRAPGGWCRARARRPRRSSPSSRATPRRCSSTRARPSSARARRRTRSS